MTDRGPTACDWCGGRVEQPPTGRRRRYDTRTCRELAYRARKTDRVVREAVERATADPAAAFSSVVETAPIPVTSVVETRSPAPMPRARRHRSGMTAAAMPLFSDE